MVWPVQIAVHLLSGCGMPREKSDDELWKLEQRMAHLQKETQRLDLTLQAIQAEGEARLSEVKAEKKAFSGPGGALFPGAKSGDGEGGPDTLGAQPDGQDANPSATPPARDAE
jgi:hypothetical protein